MKQAKTNSMRKLDQQNINYSVNTYEISDNHMNGESVAEKVGVDVAQVYKTLVLENIEHAHFVFVIPVNASLDMKSAAKVVNEDRKSTRLNSSHVSKSYAVFCLKKKIINIYNYRFIVD